MQAHEGVNVVPVPTRAVVAVDHHDLGVGVGQQRIDKRHADSACADHKVIGLDWGYGHLARSVGIG